MFGYCVWLEFIKNHPFYTINKIIAGASGAQTHTPHITLDYNVFINKGLSPTNNDNVSMTGILPTIENTGNYINESGTITNYGKINNNLCLI